MLYTDRPAPFPIPFASGAGGGYIRDIPTDSQIGIVDGAASLHDGFPPLNFQPIASGGIPPDGKDFNDILNRTSAWSRWQAAGGPITYDAALSAAIGGYPAGAFLQSAVTHGLFYVSTVDGNVTNPDGGGSANWQALLPVKANGGQIAAGLDDATYITPAGLASLRAGNPDVVAGASSSLYVSPAALASLRAGVLDVEAGTSTSLYVTPASLAGLPSAAGNPGHMQHPNGFIEAWGWQADFISGEGYHSVSLGFTFPHAVFNVACGAINTSGSNNRDTTIQWNPDGNLSTLTFYAQNNGGGGANMDGLWWRAIGN